MRLVESGKIGCSGEYLADRLWPDADATLALSSLHSTLHRLRQYLTVPEAVVHRDGRFALNWKIVYVDVWELNLLLSRLKSVKDPAEKQRINQRIETIWATGRGVMLEYESNQWLKALSERVRRAIGKTPKI